MVLCCGTKQCESWWAGSEQIAQLEKLDQDGWQVRQLVTRSETLEPPYPLTSFGPLSQRPVQERDFIRPTSGRCEEGSCARTSQGKDDEQGVNLCAACNLDYPGGSLTSHGPPGS